MATAILDLDIEDLPARVSDLTGYTQALVLVRCGGQPLRTFTVPVIDGWLDEGLLREKAMMIGSHALWGAAIRAWLGEPVRAHAAPHQATVAVCTRDRPDDLRRCLDGLMRMPDDGQELLVVDNAPSTSATADLVRTNPRLRYVREDRPGLNCARNRALHEASHPIVAFTDDDSVPDPGWLRALLPEFADPLVLCVTGLTLPFELETPDQEWFERVSTFNRGFQRRTFDLMNHDPLAVGRVGAGANMALRRTVVDKVGAFVEALDAGTPTRSGGDHEMMVRILREGYRITYQPAALNWHRHRRSREALLATLYGYGVGVHSMYAHLFLEHGEWGVLRRAWGWFLHSHAKGLARALLRRPSAVPAALVLAELWGCFVGPWAYLRSRRIYAASAAPAPE